MTYKRQIKYLIVAILSLGLCIVVLADAMLKEGEKVQSQVESQLPFGDYLPTAQNPLIRVVIKTKGFLSIVHSEVSLHAEKGMTIVSGDVLQEVEPGATFSFYPDDVLFKTGSIRVETKTSGDRITISTLSRGYGIPSYRGAMELYSTAEGIVIVNELPLEEYLYAVVPSEMPASYAKEALKSQAVCARSYAYGQMMSFAYPQYLAHVDDSVSFQVYGNSGEHENTTRAVKETAGKKLWFGGKVVKTYYYSTSCGHSTDVGAWGTTVTQKYRYLLGVPICNERGEAYEKDLPWYRWKAVIPAQTLENIIELNTKTELGTLQNVTITKYGTGGVVLELVAQGNKGSVTIRTENKIRTVLGGGGFSIEKQDGSVVSCGNLLPSAFFEIEKKEGNFIIAGGGYGHGIGMSQNGANEMAKEGKTYEEILTFFYSGTKVE